MYTKHIWLARLGTGLNKFLDTVSGNTLVLQSTPDSVQQEGTPFSAGWMNDMENGIYNSYPLAFYNVTVPTSAWSSNATYTDYPYRASVPLTGVTSDMVPEVIFGLLDATSGDYAPVCQSYNGGVYIYSSVSPSAALTIPTITARTVNNV